MEPNEFTGDFARLIPNNHAAQTLFSKTYMYVKENDTFHLLFMDGTDNERFHDSTEPVESSTDYDTHHDTDTESSRASSVSHLGYFILSFDEQRLPEIPQLGWRVGRGASKWQPNRGVDLLLAIPRDNLGKSLASIHMVFRFNAKSGFLMLRGGSAKVPVEYSKNGVWKSLEFEKEQLMHQSSTILRAGRCEYELKYTVEEKYRDAYFQKRIGFLEALFSPKDEFQEPVFRKIPGDKCVPRGRYLEFETQGSGAFGWITQGVDLETGDPIAIKELRITSRRSGFEVLAEVKMGMRFMEKKGLLPTVDSFCEHGHHDGCCDMEKFYIIMPYARSDLSVDFWNDEKTPRKRKLQLLKELLEGIRTLHEMEIMHRDIRLKNMLIMSTVPPRASLCDYGKAIQAKSSTVTTIGPIPTLAPEVWTVRRDGPYTAKIDMWAYGYAIAEILVFIFQKSQGPKYFYDNNPITSERHSQIFHMLRFHCSQRSEDEPLVDLVSKLLVWKPEERWSADQALQHECWSPIAQQQDKEDILKGVTSGTKRSLTSTDD